MADKDEKEKDSIPKEEDRILYDLSIPQEWPETATLVVRVFTILHNTHGLTRGQYWKCRKYDMLITYL